MYTIEFIARGEQFRYTTDTLSLVLERTYCEGHRLFTQSITAEQGQEPLTFDQRTQIIKDLCEFFATYKHPTIFVIWETDPHRMELETLLNQLKESGELISIEIDNEKKRQAAMDRENLSFLKAGWKVTMEGREFTTPEEYKKWRKGK